MLQSNFSAELDDRHRFDGRPYFLNGTQSLIRLLQLEKRRRASAGLNTAVYVSGYRGSPLGTLDQSFNRAGALIDPDIRFVASVNEDIAATAVWGTQQVGTFGEGRYDGVSAAWYGKGPGVDRTGDVFKHANLAGTARQGGVLAIAGDDHTCKSSTTAHQSEYALADAMIPVLAPASIAEQLEYGLIGWELSRFSGLWAAMKVVTEIMDSSESLANDPNPLIVHPDIVMPPDGLSLRWPDTPLAQEERLHRYRLPAALAFARANGLDRLLFGGARARLGIVTVGKAHADTLQALSDLGLDHDRVAARGVRLYKVAMPWPLEPEGLRAFADGLEKIIVIEEKRGLVEDQLRNHLYGRAGAPVVIGKADEMREPLFPASGELDAGLIAREIGARILELADDAALRARLTELEARSAAMAKLTGLAQRPPHFCSGCPHNSSTKVPDGSKAFAGIGCHYLVQPMERETGGFTHMGGEGANWIGLAPHSTTPHMFQNIGDGTYFHSGSMAIRAAVAAKVNITYKVLFNDAVAMTGGQPVDGELTVAAVVAQVLAEGVRRVVVVSDDPDRDRRQGIPDGVAIRPRAELDEVQRELREIAGVTVLVYHQTCATELRRLRKRGRISTPDETVIINDLVCEGCGDCSRASNCLSVIPVETELGRKRAIDQSTCNKDRSCLDGFCPSFVTVKGGSLRKQGFALFDTDALPMPELAVDADNFAMVVTGIGGTGVVTIGAIIGMAAHLDGHAVRVMDMTGLAQKGGAVVSHVQLATDPTQIGAAKVSAGAADLLLVCDLVVGTAPANLGRIAPNGHVIANDHESITGLFTRDPEFSLPTLGMRNTLTKMVPPDHIVFCDATDLATRLLGEAVGANLFLMGLAWQRGLLPLSFEALDRAIELNGTAIAMNRQAFAWGRFAAINPEAVRRAAADKGAEAPALAATLDEVIARRVRHLTDYQDRAYANTYEALVNRVRDAEMACLPGSEALADTVARTLFQLMAYKDEYEVARLHTATGFLDTIAARFEGRYTIDFHLAPPLLARRDPATGKPRKSRFGSYMVPVFRLLAKGKRLRGTPFDIFGMTAERRMEQRLIGDYRALLVDELLPRLSAANLPQAIKLAAVASAIKGYGHVKIANAAVAEARQSVALAAFRDPPNARSKSQPQLEPADAR